MILIIYSYSNYFINLLHQRYWIMNIIIIICTYNNLDLYILVNSRFNGIFITTFIYSVAYILNIFNILLYGSCLVLII